MLETIIHVLGIISSAETADMNSRLHPAAQMRQYDNKCTCILEYQRQLDFLSTSVQALLILLHYLKTGVSGALTLCLAAC